MRNVAPNTVGVEMAPPCGICVPRSGAGGIFSMTSPKGGGPSKKSGRGDTCLPCFRWISQARGGALSFLLIFLFFTSFPFLGILRDLFFMEIARQRLFVFFFYILKKNFSDLWYR